MSKTYLLLTTFAMSLIFTLSINNTYCQTSGANYHGKYNDPYTGETFDISAGISNDMLVIEMGGLSTTLIIEGSTLYYRGTDVGLLISTEEIELDFHPPSPIQGYINLTLE